MCDLLAVFEKTMHSIRTQEDGNIIKKASDSLISKYKTDTELTVFTALDFEDFQTA